MSPKRTRAQQKAKIAKRSDKHARRVADRLPVRCDGCGLVQPFSRGDGSRRAVDREPDVAGCLRCGGHYGTYV